MGRLAWAALLLTLIISSTGSTEASQLDAALEKVVEVQLTELDTREIERTLASIDAQLEAQLPSLDLKEIIFGGKGVDWIKVGQDLINHLFREVVANLRLLTGLLVLAVMGALMQNLQASFLSSDSVDISVACCLLMLLHLSIKAFQLAVTAGTKAVDAMMSLMYALLPLLTTALAAVGGMTSAAVMHPILIAAVGLMGMLVQKVVFPLLQVTVALGIAGNLFPDFPVKRLAGLVERTAGLLLGTAFVAFTAVVAARGMLAPVADGVTMRAAKYLGGKIVPILGNTFSQALEVAVGGSLLIKNGLGVLGLSAIILIAAFPLIKILALVFIYRIVTAVIEPISDSRLVAAMASCGSVLTIVFVAVLISAVIFLLIITLLVGMGNLTALIR
ncbi:MAG TPA: stage III sporulation protein AE [Firmicutes bacterium]|nr:stage III sporulation protein AE [Bacillota bacterium]